MSRFKLILFIFVLAFIAIGSSLVFVNSREYAISTNVRAEVPASPTPTVIVPSAIETEVMVSPDGERKLTMKRQELGDIVRYSFLTSDLSEDQQLIYTKELHPSQDVKIPFNSWSPDNVYFFIKESNSTQDDYYVFFESGEQFSEGSQYLDIQALFKEKVPGYRIEDVTGWAAPNLLLVNTQETQGNQKFSFWFEIPSQSFIQLSTYFR